MNKRNYSKIKKIFMKNNGYARTQDIIDAGIHTSYLYQLLEEGVISKIKRGLFQWENYNSANEEFISVSKIVPKGVFCLLSALSYYDITTINPWQYHLAIFRDDRKPVLPDYPPINIYYFSKEQYEIGIQEINMNNHKIKIYDIEKTICDCLRYRNEIGMNIVKEALNEYVIRDDRNIDKLLRYADKIGIYNLLNKYLEVLLWVVILKILKLQ